MSDKVDYIRGYLPSASKVGVMVGLPSNGELMPSDMVIALAMQPPPTQMSVGYLCIKGKPVKDAREMIAKSALEVKAKYLWFIDDDTVPPPNTLRRLLYVLENNPSVMVAGGIYVTKTTPPSPVIFQEPGLGPYWQWKVGEVFEVQSMGAGCMLISCDVFKHLTPPYFPWPDEYPTEPNGTTNSTSEDVSFCQAVRAAGFKVVAHGGILCEHYNRETGLFHTLPPDSYPFQPNLIGTDQQDSTIKE